MDVKTIATANFVVQLLLGVVVVGGAYLAARKRKYPTHCTFMRVAVGLQIVTVFLVMLPSMLGYLTHESPGAFFNTEILVHHSLGVVLVALWVYINLVVRGTIKGWGTRVAAMRLAFGCWALAFLLGAHLYLTIWL